MSPAEESAVLVQQLGFDGTAGELVSCSPIDGQEIGRVPVGDPEAACAGRPRPFSNGVRSGPEAGRARAAARRRTARREPLLAQLITLEAGKIVRRASAKCRR